MKRSILFIFALFSIFSKTVLAKNDFKPNGMEYFITTSIYTQDKGTFQFSFFPEYDKGRDDKDVFFPLQIEYGITDAWTIFFTPTLYTFHEEDDHWTDGFGDIDLATEYAIFNINKQNFNVAFFFNLHLPTASIKKKLTEGWVRYEPSIILAQDYPDSVWTTQLFSQIGFSFVQRVKHHPDPDDDRPNAHYFVWNNGIAKRSKNLNFSLELNWFTNTWNHHGDDNELYVTPGVFYDTGKNVYFGVGVPIGLTSDSDYYRVIGAIEISFG